MSTETIKIGQVWEDLDPRNAKLKKNGEVAKARRVEIVALPTLSSKGVMKVISAPRNRTSEGQLREFTRGKLLAYYGLVR
ncbi:hypothetical protein SEA_SUCHA_55 [Microbacterium phage Sucha]|nr:hypothetical protein SEA_SUCHA_55 [Microbacterium phage Sucha]